MNTLKLKKDTELDQDLVNAIRKAFSADDPNVFELDIEIFSVGKWNGINFTNEDLHTLASSFNTLKQVLKVPLKIGHNKEQPITDGQPALGWIDSVRVEGNKLFAKAIDMPEIVYNAMKKKLYRNVSIEASFDVKYKENVFKKVLTGVALLGADLPAVNNLKDLTTYMSANLDELSLGDAQCFTYGITNKGDSKMSEALLKEQLEVSNKKFEAEQAKTAKLENDVKTIKATNEALITSQTEAKFNADKTVVEDELESLVKDKKLTPAKRDELTAMIKDAATLEHVKFTATTIKDMNVEVDLDEGEQGKHKKGDNKDEITGDADIQLSAKIAEHQVKHGVSFGDAQTAVFKANPELAKEYINSNDEVED